MSYASKRSGPKRLARRLFQDFPANHGNTKAKVVVFLFRMAQVAGRLKKPWSLFGRVYLLAYVMVDLLLGIEIPWQVSAGRGLQIFHGNGLVIHYQAQIGRDCILRQGTTLGSANLADQRAPVLGDRVDVGCNVCIIGPVRIGNDVVIGAGSVVVNDVPDNAVVVGNPARVVRINEKPRPTLSVVG
jgi:putative colanic acid biosynthesis acetyltransferase WcaB